MKKLIYIVLATAFVIACCVGAYYYWELLQQKNEPVQTAQVEIPSQVPPVENKPLHALIETTPTELPPLEESDHYVVDALNGLLNPSLLEYLNLERVIHNVVATIDNLPRDKISVNVMPIRTAKGKFLVDGHDDNLTISPRNAARYTPYVNLAEALDTKKIVAMYISLIHYSRGLTRNWVIRMSTLMIDC